MNKDKEFLKKVRYHLSYNKNEGIFRWRNPIKYNHNLGKRSSKGDPVNSIKNKRGYVRVRVFGKKFREHRLAWFYVKGYWPKQLDHINGKKDDNRICNLRECNNSQNQANISKKKKDNGLPMGVWRSGKKFRATISKRNKSFHFGSFDTPEEAHEKYKKEHALHHGKFSPYFDELNSFEKILATRLTNQ